MSNVGIKLLKQRLGNTSLLVCDWFSAAKARCQEENIARSMIELSSRPNSTMMWEILVPAMDENGNEIPVEKHHKWDDVVREHAKGLTLLKTAKGTWTHPDTNQVITEPMIPVRISCSREAIIKIAEFTKVYYNQHTVLAYQVSTDVIMI